MFVLTSDFILCDINQIYISESRMYNTKYTVKARLSGDEAYSKEGAHADLYETFDKAESRKVVSMIVAALNDGKTVVSMPEIIAKLRTGPQAAKDPVIGNRGAAEE